MDERPHQEGDVDHDHDHDHDHDILTEDHTGFRILGTPNPTPASAEYLSAIAELLIEKGILAADEIRRKRAELRTRGPDLGARVIARAWTDTAFLARLLEDSNEAVRELGIEPVTASQGRLVALENTDEVHHVVVCTLCSCYPIALLGPAPDWYRSDDYRSRIVSEPRDVLRGFGLNLPQGMQIRVVDSTAECRYLVVPRRPHGIEGLAIDQVEALITPESLVGTAEALPVNRQGA
jgi:hypothetical protein